MKHRYLSKSFLDDFDGCGRYAYLSRYHNGRGLTPVHSDPSQRALGSAVHKGCETLFETGSLPMALALAWKEFNFETHGGGLSDRVIVEYQRLVQQVLTFWFKFQYPRLLTEYTVVQTERQETVRLTEDLSIIARPDAILKSNHDGRFYDHSLKTAKSYGRIKHPQALIDTQGLTETIIMAVSCTGGRLEDVGGVLMEYLIVGEMDTDDDGSPIVWHPLMRGWTRLAEGAAELEYAWKWEFPNPSYDPMAPKSPSKNPKNRTLKGKDGWTRITAFEYPGGPGAWVDDLLARKFTPTHIDPTTELIHAPVPYYRQPGQIESFVTQTIAQQTEVSKQLVQLEAGELTLDQAFMFKQDRGYCVKYGERYKCGMWDVCWGDAGRDPLARGYKVRESLAEKTARKAQADFLTNEQS